MKSEQSIAILKALADQSRLAIVNSLLERPQYVEEIARRHALAPSTVSFHLRKLEQAGLISTRREQYYQVIEPNLAIFNTTLREIVAATPAAKELQDERMEQYRRKVLDAFFVNGTLEKLPAQHKKRLIVLEQFALRFELGRHYSETEVTALIAPLFDDYCTVRRLLVDEGLIRREAAEYWREQELSAPGELAATTTTGSQTMNNEKKRSEVKRVYKQTSTQPGVYQIRNKANGKLFIDSSTNLEGARNSRLFQLKMGSVVFNEALKQELQQFGAENFDFEVLEVLKPVQPGEQEGRLLADLELRWLEKLRPFGERGYNSEKSFEREKEKQARRSASKD
ncbi:hypothetical protein GMST_07080 [Geomonas silvestris]|uniref:HTH arsR-type domain-containing protein n=1 Tax=Geomonas silvestris TaxID=2740184 RepID=A0A6V8MEX6_9BACT|nr:metalloregulator ArsR/SmtB family transcription factor [Geomonas silvestris]GFO58383.1 hypothetical protein GMST_07080 [Geomonas silvestris]